MNSFYSYVTYMMVATSGLMVTLSMTRQVGIPFHTLLCPIRMTSRHPLGEFQVVCPQGFLGSFFLMGVAMMFSFLVMSLLLGYILVNLDFSYLEIF